MALQPLWATAYFVSWRQSSARSYSASPNITARTASQLPCWQDGKRYILCIINALARICLLIAFILVQVGSLLLVFLPASLSEQIRARKFFHKSGRLVKDSIITLSDSSFSRDVTDQVTFGAALVEMLCQQAWLAPSNHLSDSSCSGEGLTAVTTGCS